MIEVKSESSQGTHSAPFPRALVEFFLLAFSDEGDVVFDPFMGSGTTMAAAALLDRAAYGCELSAGYCDVILHRIWNLTGETPLLLGAGDEHGHVPVGRGGAWRTHRTGFESEGAGLARHQTQRA